MLFSLYRCFAKINGFPCTTQHVIAACSLPPNENRSFSQKKILLLNNKFSSSCNLFPLDLGIVFVMMGIRDTEVRCG